MHLELSGDEPLLAVEGILESDGVGRTGVGKSKLGCDIRSDGGGPIELGMHGTTGNLLAAAGWYFLFLLKCQYYAKYLFTP